MINWQFPGPQIEAVTNDNLIINVFNSLDEPFLLSWLVSLSLSLSGVVLVYSTLKVSVAEKKLKEQTFPFPSAFSLLFFTIMRAYFWILRRRLKGVMQN